MEGRAAKTPKRQCSACGKVERHAPQCPVLRDLPRRMVPCPDCGGTMLPIHAHGTQWVPPPFVFQYLDEATEPDFWTGVRPTVGYIRAEICEGCQRVRFYGVLTKIEQDVEEGSDLPIPAASPQQAPETLPLPASGPASEEESEP